jgi:hypothetical protein
VKLIKQYIEKGKSKLWGDKIKRNIGSLNFEKEYSKK